MANLFTLTIGCFIFLLYLRIQNIAIKLNDNGLLALALLVAEKANWEQEYIHWNKRDLTGKEYVYWWVDGIYLQVRQPYFYYC